MDYRKLNAWIEKDYFPMPFMDQMLDCLAGKGWYYFLDGYSGYNQTGGSRQNHIYLPVWNFRV